jgi:prevent-host-death family protein
MEVNIHEAKTHFSRLLERVAVGEEVIIAKAGKPVAKLVPLKKTPKKRVFGSAKASSRFRTISMILTLKLRTCSITEPFFRNEAILDTHAFLWALAGDTRMSRHARDTFAGPTGLWLRIG